MTADEFVAVNFRLWLRQPATRRNHWILGAALVLLGVSAGLAMLQAGRVSSWSSVIFLAVGVLYGLLHGGLVRYQLRRGYSRNPALREPISFTFDADGLRDDSATGRCEVRWDKLRRAAWVRPHWLLLYPTETGCFYVDLRQLQAPATPNDLGALLHDQHVLVRGL